MTYGSCLAIFSSTGCSNSNGYLTQLNVCYPAHIYSARVCTKTGTILKCPAGQQVKAMEISGSNGLAGGISIHCYGQDESVAAISNESFSLREVGVTDPVRITCTEGIAGLVNLIDDVRDVVLTTTPVCNNSQCPAGEFVVGVTASIEEHSKNNTKTRKSIRLAILLS